MNLHSTDAYIKYYNLRALADDQGYFLKYFVLLIYRQDLNFLAPHALAAIHKLEGQISETEMIAMNARAKLDKVPAAQVAGDFLRTRLGIEVHVRHEGLLYWLWQRTGEHLLLVGALIAAGGYGQPILTGIRLDDLGLILEGTIPAAAMALLIQGGFEWVERAIVPKGLRLESEGDPI